MKQKISFVAFTAFALTVLFSTALTSEVRDLDPQPTQTIPQLVRYNLEFSDATIILPFTLEKEDGRMIDRTLFVPISIYIQKRQAGERIKAFITRWIEENPRRLIRFSQ